MLRWPAIDSGRPGAPNLYAYLLMVPLNMFVWSLLGIALTGLGSALKPIGPDVFHRIDAFGQFVAMSWFFSWIGYLIGVPLLHFCLRRHRGGWAVVLADGLIVGLIASLPFYLAGAGPLFGRMAIVLSPPMALSYAALLRLRLWAWR